MEPGELGPREQEPLSLAGHKQLDHTADLAFEVWAGDLAGLYDEAARALIQVMTEATVPSDQTRAIALDAFDAEDRFVRFLNEVIYLAVNQGFLVQSAKLTFTAEGLTGELTGGRAPLVGELKAVTYHDLHVTDERAIFVVDV